MRKTKHAVRARAAKHNLGKELLQAVREMKAGQRGRVHQVKLSPVVAARVNAELSQSQFAELLGVSVRTLQEWEQGRRQPTGAAKTLIRIAAQRPEVLRSLG